MFYLIYFRNGHKRKENSSVSFPNAREFIRAEPETSVIMTLKCFITKWRFIQVIPRNMKSLHFAYKYRLLITFANSFDPHQARQNVGPDLEMSKS